MRADMFHLIVERARLRIPKRAGSHDPRGSLRGRFERELEDAPSKLGMKFPHAEKWLNENLASLRRWLLAQAGRPWSRVRAEIRAVVDPRSATKVHVLEHVADDVEENVEVLGGRPHRLRMGRREPLVAGRSALRLSAGAELREIDGRWTFVALAPLAADPDRRARCVDALVGPLDASWFPPRGTHFEKTFGRLDAYAIATREPGRRELARVRAMT